MLACTPVSVMAHPALPGHTHGFVNGFLHPLSGWDHLLAMVAVGIWGVQCGGRARWMLPLAFLATMAAGGILGMTWRVQVPMLDQGIAATVLVLGLMLAGSVRVSVLTGCWMVAFFALFHGYAHGVEMPATAAGWAYGLGFVVATAGLNYAGILAGQAMQRFETRIPIRIAGALIAIAGAFILARA